MKINQEDGGRGLYGKVLTGTGWEIITRPYGSGSSSLTPGQQRLLTRWSVGPEVVAGYSWGLVDTVVLHVRDGQKHVVVKAGRPARSEPSSTPRTRRTCWRSSTYPAGCEAAVP